MLLSDELAESSETAMTDAQHAPAESGFRHWRRQRPLIGGVLLVVSGIEMFFSGQLDFGELHIQLGIEGLQATIIPILLVLLGVLAVLMPAHHVFYGVIALADADGTPLAVMTVADTFDYDKQHEAEKVYRTAEDKHPGVAAVYAQDDVLIGGPVRVFRRPAGATFPEYRLDPAQTRDVLGLAFAATLNAPIPERARFGVFRM